MSMSAARSRPSLRHPPISLMPMQITKLLRSLQRGDRGALNALMPLVYEELKKLARAYLHREIKVTSLQATALVHETFLKLSAGRHPFYENRSHFYGIASRLMRQVLVDTARAKCAQKRNAEQELELEDIQDRAAPPDRSLLALNAALQGLEKTDPYKGRLIRDAIFRRHDRRGVRCGAVHPRP